jgi:tetratricopeptide (TPR) repeat protein
MAQRARTECIAFGYEARLWCTLAALTMTPSEIAKEHFDRAQAAYDTKRFDLAERIALEALAAVPDHAETLVLLARIGIAQKRYEAALEASKRAVAADPKNGYAHYLRGMTYELMGRYTEAVEHLRNAVDRNPMDGVYHARLAMALASMGAKEEAIACIDRALKHQSTWLVLDLAFLALMRVGETTRAIEVGEQLRKDEPDRIESHTRLAWAFNLVKRYDDGLESATRALQIDPNDPSSWFEKGFALAALGQVDESLHAYRESVRLRPKQPVVFENIAKLLRKRAQYEEAERELVRGLANNEGHKGLISLLADTREQLDKARRDKIAEKDREERARIEDKARALREKLDAEARAAAGAEAPKRDGAERSKEAVAQEVRTALEREKSLREQRLRLEEEEDQLIAEAEAKLKLQREKQAQELRAKRESEVANERKERGLATRTDYVISGAFFVVLALAAAVLWSRGC